MFKVKFGKLNSILARQQIWLLNLHQNATQGFSVVKMTQRFIVAYAPTEKARLPMNKMAIGRGLKLIHSLH